MSVLLQLGNGWGRYGSRQGVGTLVGPGSTSASASHRSLVGQPWTFGIGHVSCNHGRRFPRNSVGSIKPKFEGAWQQSLLVATF